MKSISNSKCLYVVSTIKLREKSQEDLETEFEIFKIKYKSWKNSTFEEFLDFQKEWNSDKYKLQEEDNAYFLEYDKARECVESNTYDINDGGVYNYALIKKVRLNSMYGKFSLIKVQIFKFDKDNMMYNLVEDIKDDECKFISSKFIEID